MAEIKHDLVYYALCVLCGIICFSPYSTYIVMDRLGIPFSAPEIFIALFCIVLGTRFRSSFHFDCSFLIKSSICLIVLLLISTIYARYPLYNILGCLRVYFDLLLVLSLSKSREGLPVETIYCFSIGAVIGGILRGLSAVSSYMVGESNVVVQCVNMLSVPLAITIPLLYRKWGQFAVSVFLCLFLFIVSGTRRIGIVIVIPIAVYLLMCRKKFSGLIVIVLLILLANPFYRYAESFVESNVPVLYYRVFQKTDALLSGNIDDSDQTRLNIINSITEDLSIFPRGFVSRDTAHHDTGHYIDFPLSELAYSLGYLLAGVLILFLIYQLFTLYHKYKICDCSMPSIIIIMMVVMFSLLFVEGTFLSSSYSVPFTGYLLGQFIYYRNSYKHIN